MSYKTKNFEGSKYFSELSEEDKQLFRSYFYAEEYDYACTEEDELVEENIREFAVNITPKLLIIISGLYIYVRVPNHIINGKWNPDPSFFYVLVSYLIMWLSFRVLGEIAYKKSKEWQKIKKIIQRNRH